MIKKKIQEEIIQSREFAVHLHIIVVFSGKIQLTFFSERLTTGNTKQGMSLNYR